MNKKYYHIFFAILLLLPISAKNGEAIDQLHNLQDITEDIIGTVSHFFIAAAAQYYKEIAIAIIFIIVFLLEKSKSIIMIPIRRAKHKIEKWNLKRKFDEFDESAEESEDVYIENALNQAISSNKEEKKLGILQLSQFKKEKAMTGLIKILSDEKDSAFKKMEIMSLYAIIKRKDKEN